MSLHWLRSSKFAARLKIPAEKQRMIAIPTSGRLISSLALCLTPYPPQAVRTLNNVRRVGSDRDSRPKADPFSSPTPVDRPGFRRSARPPRPVPAIRRSSVPPARPADPEATEPGASVHRSHSNASVRGWHPRTVQRRLRALPALARSAQDRLRHLAIVRRRRPIRRPNGRMGAETASRQLLAPGRRDTRLMPMSTPSNWKWGRR